MINNEVFLAIGVGAIAVIVFLVFHIERKKNQTYADFFQKQAQRRNGRLMRIDSFSPPQLYFTYRDIEVIVFLTQIKSGQISKVPPCTFIVADFPQPIECEFQVYGDIDRGRIEKTILSPYMKLQSNPFDEAFTIKSSDQYFIESIFTHEVQQQLLECRAYKPLVEFYQNKLAISVPFLVLDEKILDKLVEATRGLIGRVQDIGEHQ